MMTTLWLYGYAIGVASSRKLEKAPHQDVAIRVLAARLPRLPRAEAIALHDPASTVASRLAHTVRCFGRRRSRLEKHSTPTRYAGRLQPSRAAPYFLVASVIHLAAIASRFDAIAAQLPPPVALAILVGQCPLLLLSGFFESQLDHGGTAGMPRWMQIRSRPVRLAFTFGFTYLVIVALQTWDVSIGPLKPTPPASFPLAQRAAWFAMFTVGAFFPFYLAATRLLIPVLRALTWPLRQLPDALGALLALGLGGGIGLIFLAAVTSARLREVISGIQAAIARDPALAIGVTLATVLLPLLLGLALRGRRATRE